MGCGTQVFKRKIICGNKSETTQKQNSCPLIASELIDHYGHTMTCYSVVKKGMNSTYRKKSSSANLTNITLIGTKQTAGENIYSDVIYKPFKNAQHLFQGPLYLFCSYKEMQRMNDYRMHGWLLSEKDTWEHQSSW